MTEKNSLFLALFLFSLACNSFGMTDKSMKGLCLTKRREGQSARQVAVKRGGKKEKSCMPRVERKLLWSATVKLLRNVSQNTIFDFTCSRIQMLSLTMTQSHVASGLTHYRYLTKAEKRSHHFFFTRRRTERLEEGRRNERQRRWRKA